MIDHKPELLVDFEFEGAYVGQEPLYSSTFNAFINAICLSV